MRQWYLTIRVLPCKWNGAQSVQLCHRCFSNLSNLVIVHHDDDGRGIGERPGVPGFASDGCLRATSSVEAICAVNVADTTQACGTISLHLRVHRNGLRIDGEPSRCRCLHHARLRLRCAASTSEHLWLVGLASSAELASRSRSKGRSVRRWSAQRHRCMQCFRAATCSARLRFVAVTPISASPTPGRNGLNHTNVPCCYWVLVGASHVWRCVRDRSMPQLSRRRRPRGLTGRPQHRSWTPSLLWRSWTTCVYQLASCFTHACMVAASERLIASPNSPSTADAS